MRVFVAGGSRVLGRRLVPQLVARGHEVTATCAAKLGLLGQLGQLGAEAVVMDGLDARPVGEAVFYGPGTPGDQAELVRRRQYPVVGGGTGYSSWARLDDAASATVLAWRQGFEEELA
ncbi:hypothetical protein [Nonomuraea sp. NPDC048916]|uniref:hypothetical protein n=1 Tax=Nonomuraea sp. NPDC048916 TaxID=3154232 RepID=UPI003407F368